MDNKPTKGSIEFLSSKGWIVVVLAGLLVDIPFIAPSSALAAQAPYPPSPVISGVTWDFSGMTQAAPGSDEWPITWSSDDNLYTSWGDGGGFGGTNDNGRVSIGVARVSGTGDSWQGTNVFGGFNSEAPATFVGKSAGILSVGGVLYMNVQEQDVWEDSKMGFSTDFGHTWTFSNGSFSNSPWDFTNGNFVGPTFLQFGKDYAGARDNYVYGYDVEAGSSPHNIVMFRVPKTQIMTRASYEFFAGLDGSGNPTWTADINQMKPVFTDPNGVGWGVRAFYNPVLHRYLLTDQRNDSAAWGIFDAPEPWGPWTTVAYYDTWIDSTFKFEYNFNQKWMSSDGLTLYMVFSGQGSFDAFNVIKATFTLKTGDSAPPSIPTGLSATAVSSSQINLTWAASTDNVGVTGYKVYRNGSQVGTSTTTTYADTGLLPLTTYTYTVSAYDASGNTSAQSGSATGTTLAGLGGGGIIVTNLIPSTYSTAFLTTGSAYYGDRTFTLTSIPILLNGGLWIKTNNDDKIDTSASIFLSFSVNVPVTVYVGYDSRATFLPAWLASGWTATGAQIVTTDTTLNVFSKTFSAGTITLGGNSASPASGAGSMYTVILVRTGGDATPPSSPTGLVVK
jgi:hypothetical protein